MWTALVLACISSLSFSESRVAPRDPGTLVFNQTQADLVTKSTPRETTDSIFNRTSEGAMTPSPVTLAREPSGAAHSAPAVTAGRTPGTDGGALAAAVGPANLTNSKAPTPTSTQPTPASTAALSTPRTQAPSDGTLPTAAPRTTLATSTQTAAATTADASSATMANASSATTANASSATTANASNATTADASSTTMANASSATTANASSAWGSQGPNEHTPRHSTASPTFPTSPHALNTFTQGPTTQPSTTRPMADTASRPTPPLENTTPEPTPSVAAVSTTAVTAEGPAASTVPAPVPQASATPGVKVTSPTTPPSPVSSPRGATGPATPSTPEQVWPEATGGPASSSPTPGSSGNSQVPTTDSCQLSTQGQYLAVTTRALPLSPVNKGALLAMLLLGVAFLFAVLVLFALQAYENYKKKDYTQVDYLINGMYADSEM